MTERANKWKNHVHLHAISIRITIVAFHKSSIQRRINPIKYKKLKARIKDKVEQQEIAKAGER